MAEDRNRTLCARHTELSSQMWMLEAHVNERALRITQQEFENSELVNKLAEREATTKKHKKAEQLVEWYQQRAARLKEILTH
ncbi:hypothetical protein LTR62_001826 [Meristemomyces frigidus]|uniref:Uncharacterized protein n=1 Tax=Meristemomyces frigidus TaxID=1508187 RepID=A0AAN7YSJ0_9PEZI|nr:hypothetical protein LTR62_001826 [Meristemomyces frigidus]